MRLHGLKARPRRRGLPQDEGQRSVIAGNVLDRPFSADEPNRKWVADFTYHLDRRGQALCCCRHRSVLAPRRGLVHEGRDGRPARHRRTDDGDLASGQARYLAASLGQVEPTQYTSENFQRLMADKGVPCSMSRSGDVWDNAEMESFFPSLKTERIARKTYRTRNQARADVFDHIERFYNTTRRYSTLGYLSPVDFERQANVAWLGVRESRLSSVSGSPRERRSAMGLLMQNQKSHRINRLKRHIWKLK